MPGARGRGAKPGRLRPLAVLLGGCLGVAIITGISLRIFCKKPPEIQQFILLSLDNLRADRVGCYGNERNVSPCLDSLAAQGTQFLSAFIPYAFTPPSHASMLTSLYPSVFDLPLDPKIQTLASILRDHGYKTAALTGGGWMSAGYGILNGFEESDDRVFSLDSLENKTRKWLKQNVDQKFFLFLHTYAVHVPFVAPEKYFREFADPSYSGPVQNRGESTTAFINEANEGKTAVTPEDRQRLLDIYDGQIRAVDDFLCSLRDTLEQMGLRDKTMWIITSDHGEQFYEFQNFGHNSVARPFADISTRVPLVVSCPSLPRKGRVSRQVESIDLPPTILEAAQIKTPETFQGQSLFPILRKRCLLLPKKKREVFFQMERWAGIRTEKWKLVLDFITGEKGLYDMAKDPAERENISQSASARTMNPLMNKLRIFQEKNNSLKERLGITEVTLADPRPSASLSFDEESLFLASLDDRSFSYQTRSSRQSDNFTGKRAQFLTGKFGRGFLLDPESEADFPLATALSASSGAIEFWLKINKEAVQNQKILQLDFVGKDTLISVQANLLWQWGGGLEKRGVIEIKRQPSLGEPIRLPTRYSWNKWHHVLLAWEEEEVYLLIDGLLASRQSLGSTPIFEQEATDLIRVSGENGILDELRVSHASRLSYVRPNKVKLDKEVIERLKALGYVGTKDNT
jgi:arylsulfatase A-like enzyme